MVRRHARVIEHALPLGLLGGPDLNARYHNWSATAPMLAFMLLAVTVAAGSDMGKSVDPNEHLTSP